MMTAIGLDQDYNETQEIEALEQNVARLKDFEHRLQVIRRIDQDGPASVRLGDPAPVALAHNNS